MTYIPYLGTFFFSRYPSVALARNSRYSILIFIFEYINNISYIHIHIAISYYYR